MHSGYPYTQSETAKYVKDFRPISVCTTIYKIIYRILTSRLGQVIGSIVSLNQVAFFPGQQIQSHILLAYELVKGYSKSGGPPKCLFQIDMQKAYDMVYWNSLEYIMQELGLPPKVIKWIFATMSTVSYRFNVNGSLS